jgi:hypothetical protein
MLFRHSLRVSNPPFCSDHPKNPCDRFDMLNPRGVALREHENHAEFSPRVVWLAGIVRGSRVLGADMRRELLIAPPFIVHLHLVNRFANGRPGRVEHPGALAASPALKILPFDPYQFAAHRLHGTPRDLVWLFFFEDGGALVFDGTATTKAASHCLKGGLPKSPFFLNAHQDRSEYTKPKR